jgi:hypothetical protein
MKRSIPFLPAVFFFMCIPLLLSSQTVDEIIARHIEAHGGTENWDRVEALELRGNFTGFSIEKPFFAIKTRSGRYYADLYLGEVRVLEAFDGQEGWTIDPWQDIFHARKLNTAEQNVFRQKATFFTPFYHYKEQGSTVEYTGLETIDGMEMLTLKLTRPDGRFETWYLDPDTYLEYLCVSEWVDFAWPSRAEAYFDDFREVEGLILPFYTDRTFGQRNRVLQLEEVSVNPAVENRLFEMPQKAELEALAFLEGQWEVSLEVMTRRGTWYPIGNTRSVIRYTSPLLLEETIQYERIFPITRTLQIGYHDASKKYRVSVFDDLTGSLEPFEGVLTDSTFVFDNTGMAFAGLESQSYNRVEIKKSEEGGFIMTILTSGDEGKNWNPTDRFSYRRKKE